jgi:hypothetical protein
MGMTNEKKAVSAEAIVFHEGKRGLFGPETSFTHCLWCKARLAGQNALANKGSPSANHNRPTFAVRKYCATVRTQFARSSPYSQIICDFTAAEQTTLWNDMSPEEKQEFQPFVRKKLRGQLNGSTP